MTAARPVSRVAAWPTAIAAAFVAASPATAQDVTLFQPCYEQHPTVHAYAAAFEEQGWTRAADRDARFIAQALLAATTLPNAFETPEDQSRFIAEAETEAEGLESDFTFLVRDQQVLALSFSDGRTLNCILGGKRLALVETFLGGAVRPLLNSAVAMDIVQIPVPPPGVETLHFDPVRIFFKFDTDPPPAEGDVLFVAVTFRDPVQ